MDVIPPQQMVGDYPPDRVQNGDHPLERERFSPLEV